MGAMAASCQASARHPFEPGVSGLSGRAGTQLHRPVDGLGGNRLGDIGSVRSGRYHRWWFNSTCRATVARQPRDSFSCAGMLDDVSCRTKVSCARSAAQWAQPGFLRSQPCNHPWWSLERLRMPCCRAGAGGYGHPV